MITLNRSEFNVAVDQIGVSDSSAAIHVLEILPVSHAPRTARLVEFYTDYLADRDAAEFIRRTSLSYTVSTLERLAVSSASPTRRAAVLALGKLADFRSNHVLGRAMQDEDRMVRLLAEDGIRNLWRRAGSVRENLDLGVILRCNVAKQYEEAIQLASDLIAMSPAMAEAWNQRGVAHYHLGRYAKSIHDCRQALEFNPYHFDAATGMGQCYLQLGRYERALECLRRALKLNPELEGVRAGIYYVRRALKES